MNQDPTLTDTASRFRLEALAPLISSKAIEVGLHGCSHRYTKLSRSSIWRLNDETEFSEVPEATQRDLIERGLLELEARLGLRPDFFVAPSHSYDYTTLKVLKGANLAVSDGIALYPFHLGEVLHIPAQLWSPKKRGGGLWTVMIHPQALNDTFLANLDRFLSQNRQNIVDFTKEALQPYINNRLITQTMTLKSLLFKQWFYCRLRAYQGKQKILKALNLLSGGQ